MNSDQAKLIVKSNDFFKKITDKESYVYSILRHCDNYDTDTDDLTFLINENKFYSSIHYNSYEILSAKELFHSSLRENSYSIKTSLEYLSCDIKEIKSNYDFSYKSDFKIDFKSSESIENLIEYYSELSKDVLNFHAMLTEDYFHSHDINFINDVINVIIQTCKSQISDLKKVLDSMK